MRVATPDHDIPLAPAERRFRLQRALCLGLLPLFALPVLAVTADRLAPVDHAAPVDVRSVDGQPFRAPAPESAVSEQAVPATSAPVSSTTAAAAPTTTAAPAVRAAVKAPTTTAAVTTVAPTTAAPVTAPPPPVTAPPAPVATAPPTTAAPPPPPPPPPPPTTAAPRPANTQSGQATWYRWKPGNCAHNSLPKGTRVTVRADASGRTATCVVGDRGAFRNPTIIDLDATVFSQIAPLGAGRISVTISW